MIQFGNDKIKEIYVGSDKIKEVYYGSEKVWGKIGIIPEVDAFMTAALLPKSYVTPLNILVSSLISNNLWDKLIAIYPICGDNYNSLKYNLKDPRDLDSAFRLAPGGVGTPGYSTNAITCSGNFNSFISDKEVDLDSLSLSIFSTTDNVNAGRDFSTVVETADNRLIVSINYTGGHYNVDLYNAHTERATTSDKNNSIGFFTASRTSSTSLKAYRNGSEVASNTNTRTDRFHGDIFIGGINSGSLTYRTYEFICIGEGLDSDEASILYDIVTEFRNSLINI